MNSPMPPVAIAALNDLFDGYLPGVFGLADYEAAVANGTEYQTRRFDETWLDRLMWRCRGEEPNE